MHVSACRHDQRQPHCGEVGWHHVLAATEQWPIKGPVYVYRRQGHTHKLLISETLQQEGQHCIWLNGSWSVLVLVDWWQVTVIHSNCLLFVQKGVGCMCALTGFRRHQRHQTWFAPMEVIGVGSWFFEALLHLQQGDLITLGYVRDYCKRKMIMSQHMWTAVRYRSQSAWAPSIHVKRWLAASRLKSASNLATFLTGC